MVRPVQKRSSGCRGALKMFMRFLLYPAAFVLCGMLATFQSYADSLWNNHAAGSTTGDKRAVAVGDFFSIVVQQGDPLARDNWTKTPGQAAVDASIGRFLNGPAFGTLVLKGGQLPALRPNAQDKSEGGGIISTPDKNTIRIPVQVVDVLPGKKLIIEAQRQPCYSGESQDLILHAVVGLEDIMANNSIFSHSLVDASIMLEDATRDPQRTGLLARLHPGKTSPFLVLILILILSLIFVTILISCASSFPSS